MLPSPTGPHRVGVIEADIPAQTDAGVVPVVVYYPAIDEPDAPPSTALCGATSSERPRRGGMTLRATPTTRSDDPVDV